MTFILLSSGSYDDYSIRGLYLAPLDFDEDKFQKYYVKQGRFDYVQEYLVKETVDKKDPYYPMSDRGAFLLKTGELCTFRFEIYKHYDEWVLEKFGLVKVDYTEVWLHD